MRFHSTSESVQNGEITKLAIIECFVSIAAYVAVGLYFKTFRHFAIAIALAPLTLLRTSESTYTALLLYAFAGVKVRDVLLKQVLNHQRSWITITLLIALMWPLLALCGGIIRVVATVFWAVRTPLKTVREVPNNWLRQALCTDSYYPPEVVPGEEVTGRNVITPRFRQIADLFRGGKDLKVRGFLASVVAPFLIIGFSPPIFYRISFKATSLAYYPFIWAARVTVGSTESLKTRLEKITKGELEKTRRWVSGLVGTALLVRVALVLGWIDVPAAVAQFPVKRFVESLVLTNVWHWWQVTLGIDALLTFCLLYYADAALLRLDGKDAWSNELVTKTISSVSFLRASLAIVTMSRLFWLAFKAATGGYITF